jgi:hypothetical protein
MKKSFNKLPWTARITIFFLLKHMIAGACGGFVLGGLMLYFDVSKLWTLISHSPDGLLVFCLLFFGLFVTFGSIGMAWGIFGLAQETDAPEDKTYY